MTPSHNLQLLIPGRINHPGHGSIIGCAAHRSESPVEQPPGRELAQHVRVRSRIVGRQEVWQLSDRSPVVSGADQAEEDVAGLAESLAECSGRLDFLQLFEESFFVEGWGLFG